MIDRVYVLKSFLADDSGICGASLNMAAADVHINTQRGSDGWRCVRRCVRSDSLHPCGARTVCEAVRQCGDSLGGSQSLVVGNKMNSAFVRSLCRGFSVFLAFA